MILYCICLSILHSVPPRFTNITGDVNIYANDVNVINLTCQTDSSSPASTIIWYRNGQLIPSEAIASQTVGDNGGLVTSQVLEFIPTREMDGQVVECRVTHSLSQETAVYSSVTLDLTCKFGVIDSVITTGILKQRCKDSYCFVLTYNIMVNIAMVLD